MFDWSSSSRKYVSRKSVGLALCLALALHASLPAAAQQTSARRSPASRSSNKPAASAKREPIKTLQITPQGDTIGSPWTGQQGVSETTDQIMRRQRATGAQKPEPEETEAEKDLPRRDLLPLNPLSPQESQWPPKKTAEPPPPVLASPQTLGLNFTGATLSETGAFPPDTMGAVGPTQFVVAVNNRIKVFDKTTGVAGALNATTNTFFNSVRNGISTSDPRVRYDRLSGRWFIIIINVSTPNRVLLAVSDNATITAGTVWTFFFFQQDQVSPIGESGCLSDYPTLGIDANALYIGVNQFCPSFGGTTAFVVRKSSVLGAGPIVASAFRGLTGTPGGAGLYTPQGVDNYDSSATEGYFIGVDNATFGTLVVRRVSDPGGTPVLSPNAFITVPSTSFPLTVPHLGNTNGTNGRLDSLDDRLFAAHIRNGRLWTAQNISVDNTGTTVGVRTRNAARWYELSGLNTGAPTLVQAGTLFAATPTNSEDDRHYWIPSIMVSGQGHAALGVSAAGTNEFINAGTVGRLASDPLGTLGAPILYTAAAAPYNPPGNTGDTRGRRRWGDYSYTSLDPCDDMTMWTIQEFTDSLDSYGARIVKLIAPPPVTPLSANPALIPQGQSSLNVTVSGVAAGGRGFYDPGPGFGCRLAASIGGGIAINSIIYNSPTSITLNISTVGALTGSKSISVTNPDGQSATGSLLTVGLPGSCSFTLDSTTQSFSSAGGTGSFNVATAGGCAWTAISNDSWITITSGGGGVGNGSITYSVANNPGGAPRTGTMTVGGVVFIVTQNGTGLCNFSIAPTSQNFVVGGGTGNVSVTADAGCAWTATSNAAFISITSGSSGTGNGAVNYSVSANPTPSIRTGTLTIAGLTLTVTQDPVPCSFTLLPTSQTLASGGGTGNVAVTTQSGCVWSASSNDSWITIVSGAGTGSGTVNYSVGSNPSINPRTGTITIAGLTFTVMQNGATCAFTISPVSQSFGAGGGSGSIGVTALAGCAWTAVSNDGWISITTGASGSGSGTANYSVSANTSGAPRSGTVTVAGQTFTVTQASQACTFSISPTSGLFESSGGSASVSVVAPGGCGWTAASNSPWITVTSGAAGSGNGTVAYSVAVNSTVDPRVGTLTVAGQTVSVTQSGVTCVTAISPLTASIGAGGDTANVAVTAPFNCNWTATSNASWINISANASGSGNKTIKYNIAPNSGPLRTGTVTIRGRLHTVTQAGTGGGPCTFSITPSNQNFGAGGGNSSVAVTTQIGCAWTAISNVPWVTITAGSSGVGSGTVNYSVAANVATSSRSGSMTVAGQAFTVTQDPAAPSCTFTILPTSQNFISSGGTGSVSVTTQAGCAWSAFSNVVWVNITSGAAGTGSGTVNYSVSANTGLSRMGTITIAGQTFTVTQDAAPAPCTFSIAPVSQSFASAGGSGSVAVTTQAGCAWTATSNAPWITITAGSSGTGSGGVTFSVANNPSTSSRIGTLTAAGQTFTVNQGGVSSGCSFSISPSSKAFLAAAGASTVSVTVVAGSGCTWSAVSNVPWITVTSGSSGSGNGIVGYSVSANTTGVSRTGTMTIAGSTFTVKQQP